MAGEAKVSSYLDDGMADPIYFVHALVACTLLVLGLLLVADGINEGRDADR